MMSVALTAFLMMMNDIVLVKYSPCTRETAGRPIRPALPPVINRHKQAVEYSFGRNTVSFTTHAISSDTGEHNTVAEELTAHRT